MRLLLFSGTTNYPGKPLDVGRPLMLASFMPFILSPLQSALKMFHKKNKDEGKPNWILLFD